MAVSPVIPARPLASYKMKNPLIFAATALFATSLHAHDASREMEQAAQRFLASLTSEQRSKALLGFSEASRTDWHYIPKARNGLSIKEMEPQQRLFAQALLATGLSQSGHAKAATIMSLESLLAVSEKGRSGAPLRDSEMYYVTIYGDPTAPAAWSWRFEGHHLSLNFTHAGDATPAMTPSFFGSNPAAIDDGHGGKTRVLEQEEDLGRKLVKSLDEGQKKLAILSAHAPSDILNTPGRNATKPEGISYSQLTPDQRQTLRWLLEEYLFRCRHDVAAEEIAKIERGGIEKLHFGWAGGLEPGEPHYYRIQAGSFVLEYDNTQNGANHVHSVWRDFEHDFGADLLKDHYEASHRQTPADAK